MNYLAHAYLSFNIPEVLAGNMISDFVKGKKQFDYSKNIQIGIQLHRAIDTFTDAHAITKHAKQYLQPAVGAYSGAFVDVVYDHFLANDTTQFSTNIVLQQFANTTYASLTSLAHLLPERFVNMLPSMQQHNWLYNYQYLHGIDNSFKSVTRKAKYLSSSENCFKLFEANYVALEKCYNQFFPEVKEMAIAFLNIKGLV